MSKGKNKKTVIFLSIVLALAAALLFYVVFWPSIQSEYLSFRARHHNYKVYGGMTDELKDSNLYTDMQSGKSFCFLGDSITSGTVSYGIHWYQPLIQYIKGKVSYLSYPGWETQSLIDHRDIIIPADVYVIAIGINDALTLGEKSLTPVEFTDSCSYLANRIKNINPDATIYFIAPWTYLGFDDTRMMRGEQFRKELGRWCAKTEYRFIDPHPVIMDVFSREGASKFMYNRFHPKAPEGIELFSYAVLKADHDMKTSKT